ncbi:hypothetical protein GCM10018966_093310 [Streptomyces yanii]
METAPPSYKGHRYPVEIISHCVWLYHRFPLSFREVGELMLERGVVAIRDHCIPGDPPNPDKPMPLANRTFTPAWAPKSPRSSTTPAAHRIHHRARAEAVRRTALARAEVQQRPPVRQQEHTPQAAPQQPPLPAPAQAPGGRSQ